MFSFVLLSLPMPSQAAIAYIPQTLKECISVAHNINQLERDTRNLQELNAMIQEGRILASDSMTRKAVEEALDLVTIHENEFRNNEQQSAITNYLTEYLTSLDNKFLLLPMQGQGGRSASWPVSLITRSLADYSVETDMMYLTTELAKIDAMELCGSMGIDVSSYRDLNARTLARALTTDIKRASSIDFNANMMTNPVVTNPNITFGTGISSTSINAWIMSASDTVQTPINVQFTAPDDLNSHKSINLVLNFLVQHNGLAKGNARVKVTVKHVGTGESFSVTSSSHTFSTKSENFKIKESSDVNNLRHVATTIPFKKSHIKKGDLILISVTRIAPNSGTEYAGDIYLASSTFTYLR